MSAVWKSHGNWQFLHFLTKWWPQMTVDHNGQQLSNIIYCTLQGLPTDISTYSNFHFFTYFANNVFWLSHALTSNDLWPPWETVGIIYLPRATYILSLKFRQLLLLEISWLQNIQTLTSGDLKWPWSSMQNSRDHLFTHQVLSSSIFHFLRYLA